MVLREHFEQRKPGSTYGSFRSLFPLRTPSGPQWTESELESELLEQLAFAPGVYDLITQPIIHYTVNGEPRRYTTVIAVQLHACGGDLPARYLIEVKREDDLRRNGDKYAQKFRVGRLAGDVVGAAFRIMTETQIRTPYLSNARLLGDHLQADPEEETFEILRVLEANGPLPLSGAISALVARGWSEPDARHGIEQAVAYRFASCDLTRSFDDSTLIEAVPFGEILDARQDPILQKLEAADAERT